MNYWLVKSEPGTYSWERFEKEGHAMWDGVRNYQARNNLKAMKTGDAVLFYHSGGMAPEVVGEARVIKECYPDPTAVETGWVVVDLKPVRKLNKPVSLERIKHEAALKNMPLVRQGRLSVMSLSYSEFKKVLELGMTPAGGKGGFPRGTRSLKASE